MKLKRTKTGRLVAVDDWRKLKVGARVTIRDQAGKEVTLTVQALGEPFREGDELKVYGYLDHAHNTRHVSEGLAPWAD